MDGISTLPPLPPVPPMPDALGRAVPEFAEPGDCADTRFRRNLRTSCQERAVWPRCGALRTHPAFDYGVWGGTTRRQRARIRNGLDIRFGPVNPDAILRVLAGSPVPAAVLLLDEGAT